MNRFPWLPWDILDPEKHGGGCFHQRSNPVPDCREIVKELRSWEKIASGATFRSTSQENSARRIRTGRFCARQNFHPRRTALRDCPTEKELVDHVGIQPTCISSVQTRRPPLVVLWPIEPSGETWQRGHLYCGCQPRTLDTPSRVLLECWVSPAHVADISRYQIPCGNDEPVNLTATG